MSEPYRPHPAFSALFTAYTSDPDSIGNHLARHMTRRGGDDALLVANGTDVALFPGNGLPVQVEAFRRTTRGFIEITAVSHLGTAVPWLARMRELGDPAWRTDALRLLEHLDAVLAINGEAYWRDLRVSAWIGREAQIAQLVDYTCSVTHAYLNAALADESLLAFDRLRERFLDPVASRDVPVPMNDMMAATFALAYIDIAHRFIAWLRAQDIAWERAMVLIAGQSGRPTAGLTWATNNMCHLLLRASADRLVPERTLIAPFAPPFDAESVIDAAVAAPLEAAYRLLWNKTRASIEIGREMFEGYPAFATGIPVPPHVDAHTSEVDGLPALTSVHDRRGLITRLRVVMEDPGQLISNAAAHYIIDELVAAGNDPAKVFIPGFTGTTYPSMRHTA